MMEINAEGYLKIGGKNVWLIKAKNHIYGHTSIGKNLLITNKDYIGKMVKFKVEIVDDLNKFDVEDILKVAKEQIAFTDKEIDDMQVGSDKIEDNGLKSQSK